MRCLFGLLSVCALLALPVIGCSEPNGSGGAGGVAGSGGAGGIGGSGAGGVAGSGGAGGIGGSGGCTDPGTWVTVDQYLPEAAESAWPFGIHIDERNRIFVVGHRCDTDSGCWWLVRRSVDGGMSWTVVDLFQFEAGRGTIARGVGAGPDGSIFVTGYVRGFNAGGDRWLTRRSLDGGDSWSTVDEYQKAPDKATLGKDVFTSTAHRIFVVGQGLSADHRSHWTVRASEDGGESWDIAEEYRDNAFSTYANGGMASQGGGLFVAGSAFDEAGLSQSWLVRRSLDNGTNWQTADLYQHTADQGSYANDLFEDTAGNVYVVGSGDTGDSWRWLVRRSGDGGGSWSVVDDFQYPGGRVNWAYAGTTDADGAVYVVGAGDDDPDSQTKRWLVRRSQDEGDSWETVDDFRLASSGAVAYDIARDSRGSLYVVGDAKAENFATNWLVRKMACP